jgi:hypothetical protein
MLYEHHQHTWENQDVQLCGKIKMCNYAYYQVCTVPCLTSNPPSILRNRFLIIAMSFWRTPVGVRLNRDAGQGVT